MLPGILAVLMVGTVAGSVESDRGYRGHGYDYGYDGYRAYDRCGGNRCCGDCGYGGYSYRQYGYDYHYRYGYRGYDSGYGGYGNE
jgi:hypothetical protein